MASAGALSQHRKKLASHSSVIALQGAAGIVHSLSGAAPLRSEAASQAIGACLCHELRDVVEEASLWLVASTGITVTWSEAQDLLLNALAAAGSRTSSVLASALSTVYCSSVLAQESSTPSSLLAWSQHPLSSALLLNPSAASHLITSGISCLHREAATVKPPPDSSGVLSAKAARLWAALEPFFLFILLQRGMSLEQVAAAASSAGPSASAAAAGSWAMLPELVQQQLVRLACRSQPFAEPVLRVLIQAQMCCPIGSDVERARALQGVDTLMDFVETLGSLPLDAKSASALQQLLSQLFHVLLSAAYELRACGGEPLVALLRALLSLQRLLQRLQGTPPQQVQGHGLNHGDSAAVLAALLDGATAQEQEQLHLLMHNMLSPPTSALVINTDVASDRAMARVPLLCCLAYGMGSKSKVWSSHLVQLLEAPAAASHLPRQPHAVPPAWHGELRLQQQARQMLLTLGYTSSASHTPHGGQANTNMMATPSAPWATASPVGTVPLQRWLVSMACQLHLLRTQQHQQPGADGGSGDLRATAMAGTALTVPLGPSRDLLPGRQAPELPELSSSSEAVLAAALACPDPSVRVAAAAAARQLLLLRPLASLRLLPLLMRSWHCCGSASAQASPLQRMQEAQAQLSLQQLLPAMASDASVAPLAARALAPLQAESSPLLLRCLAMRLTVEGWLLTGRGWARVEAAINGYVLQSSAAVPPVELRITRASLIRAVVMKDPFKGLELICALQEAVLDPFPAVAALGIRAMAVMCETDVLDFYKAWQVVHRHYPSLPAHPLLAAAWVALLAAGALDARAYPDRARAALQALWAATRHPNEMVRLDAYKALHAYPLELVEYLEHEDEEDEEGEGDGEQGAGAGGKDAAGSAMVEPIDLEGYVRPLAGGTAGGVGDVGLGAAVESNAAAVKSAEELACLALRYEHENRRRFLAKSAAAAPAAAAAAGNASAAAAAGAAGGAAGVAGAQGTTAAAAVARESAALRHRLVSSLPSALQQQRGPLGTAAAATPGPSLLLYSPPPSSGATGSGRAGAGAGAMTSQQQVHLGFSLRLREALARPPRWSDWSSLVPLALRSWQALFTRWIADCQGDIEPIWAELSLQWRCAPPGQSGAATPAPPTPAVLESAPLAVAALAAAGAAGVDAGVVDAAACARHTEWALGQVLANLQADASRPSAVLQACAHATAVIASLLHPTDQAGRARAMAAMQHLHADEAGHGHAVRGAAAVAAAALAAEAASKLPGWGSPAADRQPPQPQGAEVVRGALGLLLSGVARQAPPWCREALAAAAQRIAAAAPAALQPVPPPPQASAAAASPSGARGPGQDDAGDDDAVPYLQGLLSGLCLLLRTQSPSHTGGPAPLLTLLQDALVSAAVRGCASLGLAPEGSAQGTPAGAAVAPQQLAALLGCLPYTFTRGRPLAEPEAAAACTADGLLRAVAAAPAADGVLRGAAAQALASLTVLAHPDAVFATAGAGAATAGAAGPSSPLDLLLTCARDIPKATHASQARVGALAGLAIFLLGPHTSLLGVPGAPSPLPPLGRLPGALAGTKSLLTQVTETSKAARAALKAVEAAAGDTVSDGRAAAAAAWMLAEVCERYAASTATEAAPAAAGGRAPSTGAVGQAEPGGAGGRGSSASAAGRLIPLASYPPAGAHRPLAEAVAVASASSLVSSAARGTDAAATPTVAAIAAALRCLAASPRLPAWDWGGACRNLWTQAEAAMRSGAAGTSPSDTSTSQEPGSGSGSGSVYTLMVDLQEAVVGLVLAHGSEPSHGLGTLLDELLSAVPQGLGMSGAHPRVLATLLRQLPQAAACLASSRRDTLLAAILTLLLQGGGHGEGAPAQLLSAAWEGLAGMLQRPTPTAGARPVPVVVSGALADVLAGALQALPPLPALLPGEAAWVAAQLRRGSMFDPLLGEATAATSRPAGDAAVTGSSEQRLQQQPHPWHQQRPILGVWCRAALGLVAAGPQATSHLLDLLHSSGAALSAMQMRCMLALAGALSYRDLATCRSAFLQLPQDQADSLACLLAEALATAPQAAQVQMLQEALESTQSATNPERALAMGAVLAAAWQAHSQGAAGAVAQHICCAVPSGPDGNSQDPCRSACTWAVECLPGSLTALLRLPQWAPSLPSLTSLLVQLVDRGAIVGRQGMQAVLATLLGLRLVASTNDEQLGSGYTGSRSTGSELHRVLARDSATLLTLS